MELFHRISYILFLSTLYYQGGSAGTVVTGASLSATVGDSLDFNCTYTLQGDDVVYPGLISWEIKKDSATTGFESIATFTPPYSVGSNTFTSTESGLKFKNRSELLDVMSNDNTTFNVVMRVRNVECADEDSYRCSVTFYSPTNGQSVPTAGTSLTVQAPAEKPYEVPVPVPDNIEEGMNVKFTCTANVGKPPGKIKWWRYRNGIVAPQSMGESSENPQVQPKVCVYNVTSSIQHNMSSDDDQSVWRCSVDNELLTTQPDQNKPNQESQRVDVYYKVRVPTITRNPDPGDMQFAVGSSVTLTCVAQGNPRPGIHVDKNANKYVWTFQASPGENTTELPSTNGVLTLNNLQESETGTYTCTAFNGFNGKSFNASKDTSLQIGPTGRPTAAPLNGNGVGLDGGALAGIIVAVVVIIVLVVVAVWCILKNRTSKDSIDEPPEKPVRNNQGLSFANRPDIVNNDKSSPFYPHEKKQYNTDLPYSDLTFDDKPRSRKPIQLYENNGMSSTPYSEVMMPSV
ncbi:cell adhesion molecule 3-like isoform X2 [Ostrea edulis]|uniref:cell adhesion molecule 3-like isoform X2 n=1 Tax=Ostrea edulis TaxID=37623 RepID=UPI00209592C7|nr:cell adhesion molecule 3-like isoform X2 [Ostrea edulis]